MNASMPSSSSAAFPPPRVTPHAWRAFGGVWRLTLRQHFKPMHWLLLAGMLALLGLFAFTVARQSGPNEHDFLQWAGRFYLTFLVPVLAFITAAGVMRDDLQADSVDYIFTRPVRRSLYVFFRYASHLVCAQVDFLVAFAVVLGVGTYFHVEGFGAAVPTFLLAQVLVVTAFSAFGFLCGMLTSRYVIVGLVYGGVIEVGIGNVPTQLNRLSILRQMFGLLEPFIPEGGKSVHPAVTTLSTPATIALLLAYTLVMLAVTAAIFSVKEFAGSRET